MQYAMVSRARALGFRDVDVIDGDLGMQIHHPGTDSEYRDIEVEVDPTSDKLITLVP